MSHHAFNKYRVMAEEMGLVQARDGWGGIYYIWFLVGTIVGIAGGVLEGVGGMRNRNSWLM